MIRFKKDRQRGGRAKGGRKAERRANCLLLRRKILTLEVVSQREERETFGIV